MQWKYTCECGFTFTKHIPGVPKWIEVKKFLCKKCKKKMYMELEGAET